MPTGVNLNRYSGSGSYIRWHSDNEPLFNQQNSPKLIVSLSLGNSVEFMVRRHAPGKFPLRFGWTMVTFWSWMVWPNRSMNIARCLGCRVLGITLPTAGLHNTLRPVHSQARWAVSSLRVRKVSRAKFPLVWGRGKLNGPLLGDWSSFC